MPFGCCLSFPLPASTRPGSTILLSASFLFLWACQAAALSCKAAEALGGRGNVSRSPCLRFLRRPFGSCIGNQFPRTPPPPPPEKKGGPRTEHQKTSLAPPRKKKKNKKSPLFFLLHKTTFLFSLDQ